MDYKFIWKGKNAEQCTKEELIEALNYIASGQAESSIFYTNSKIKDLEKELKIKDSLIDKLASR